MKLEKYLQKNNITGDFWLQSKKDDIVLVDSKSRSDTLRWLGERHVRRIEYEDQELPTIFL